MRNEEGTRNDFEGNLPCAVKNGICSHRCTFGKLHLAIVLDAIYLITKIFMLAWRLRCSLFKEGLRKSRIMNLCVHPNILVEFDLPKPVLRVSSRDVHFLGHTRDFCSNVNSAGCQSYHNNTLQRVSQTCNWN